jgi:hypothetical protein
MRGAFRHTISQRNFRAEVSHPLLTGRTPLLLEMKHGFSTALLNPSDDDEVQEEVMTWFKGQAADFYDSGIQKLLQRLNKCLDNAGDLAEK